MLNLISFRHGTLLSLALLFSLSSCAETPTHTSTGQYLDDASITAKVKARLLDDKRVNGLDIGVETRKGVVQLSGFAHSNVEIKTAEHLTREVEGVQSVQNDILLQKP